jgi:glutathione S-transferase
MLPEPATIIGSPISPYVRKVLAVCEIKGVPYRLDPIVPFFGDDRFSELSPLRRIPVFADDEVSLCDSTVICEYLEERYPAPRMLPTGFAHRGQARLRPLRRPLRQAKSKTPKARLVPWLERISTWDDFQASRTRDAVYGYLDAVFAIVEHYRVRRGTTRLRRYAFKFANLPLNDSSDPFAAVIRCTSGGATDTKTISKWARALRYVARSKVAPAQLKAFMKEVGGVNACADRHVAYLRRGAR